jgi:hypothetical protein
MRFEVTVRMTHEPEGADGARRLPKPRVSMHGPFADRREAESFVNQIWEAAKASRMERYLKTAVRPID